MRYNNVTMSVNSVGRNSGRVISRQDWKSLIAIIFLMTAFAVTSCTDAARPGDGGAAGRQTGAERVPVYSYRALNKYPHDRGAFTQGLAFEKGALFEGTGQYGKSSLRRIDLESGKILKIHSLPPGYFGEGITVFGDTIVQLTWQSNLGFVYDKNSFQKLRTFAYSTEGWGITHDGGRFIMSDGSAALYFLDPEAFSVEKQITVRENGAPVTNLNELEYVDGRIYANVWQTDRIAIIDPADGKVTGWIDLFGLLRAEDRNTPVDVLNGIAFDREKGRLFVTGKLWPWLFEIELIPK